MIVVLYTTTQYSELYDKNHMMCSWKRYRSWSLLQKVFKIIGDQTRLRILWALDQNEMCVCDIANVLKMTKSAVSHQLAILRSAGIVKYRRSGKEVYYMLDDHHITQLYEIGLLHIIHQIKSTREAEDEVSIQDQ